MPTTHTVKWLAGSESSNLASTLLDSLGIASTSSRIAYDNSTNVDMYAKVTIDFGTNFTPTTGASLTLRVLHRRSSKDEDTTTGLESYTMPVTVSGARQPQVIFPRVQLYPFVMGFVVYNGTGAALPSSNNAFYVQPYNEVIITP